MQSSVKLYAEERAAQRLFIDVLRHALLYFVGTMLSFFCLAFQNLRFIHQNHVGQRVFGEAEQSYGNLIEIVVVSIGPHIIERFLPDYGHTGREGNQPQKNG